MYHVDFRQLYVGSSVNVETTNINSGPISSSSDNQDNNYNQQTLDVISSIKDKNSTLECENKFADSNNYQRLKFKWNLSKSIFLEICGLVRTCIIIIVLFKYFRNQIVYNIN